MTRPTLYRLVWVHCWDSCFQQYGQDTKPAELVGKTEEPWKVFKQKITPGRFIAQKPICVVYSTACTNKDFLLVSTWISSFSSLMILLYLYERRVFLVTKCHPLYSVHKSLIRLHGSDEMGFHILHTQKIAKPRSGSLLAYVLRTEAPDDMEMR